jgi:hypothetical protein
MNNSNLVYFHWFLERFTWRMLSTMAARVTWYPLGHAIELPNTQQVKPVAETVGWTWLDQTNLGDKKSNEK